METITVRVTPEIKIAFEQATPETLQKLTTLLNLWHWFSLIEGRKLYWVGVREKRSQYKLRRK
jgi:hypothetical protein